MTDYFNTPDDGGLLRTWEIAQYLKGQGHRVTVICSSAHHMTGTSSRKTGVFREELIAGVSVVKTYSYPSYRASALNRGLHYALFPFLAFLAAWSIKKPDVIIVSSPPLTLLPLGFILCRAKRKKYVVEVRDAWLEFAIKRKLVPKSLIAPLQALQSVLLKKAHLIVSVTPGIKRLVDEYTKDPSKNILIMNGFEDDIDNMVKLRKEDLEQIKDQNQLTGKFIVIYTGTLGLARDHQTFARTAHLLEDYKDIVFLFIGEGEKKNELVDYCRSRGLANCRFLQLQARHKIPLFLKVSHVAINAIRKSDALESSLSNKIFDYLGNGVPVVFAGDGDTAELLERSKGGIAVEAENAEQMKEAILRLYRSDNLRSDMGRLGRDYVRKYYARSTILRKLDYVIMLATTSKSVCHRRRIDSRRVCPDPEDRQGQPHLWYCKRC